jgi:hypothetical protein
LLVSALHETRAVTKQQAEDIRFRSLNPLVLNEIPLHNKSDKGEAEMAATSIQSPQEHPVENIAKVKIPLAAGTAEGQRLLETHGKLLWRRWGPYVSERSWGTVREDYSSDGAAWDFLSHDAARSKAYRWGEDGLAAICDRYELLVLSLALWNRRDPILKERAFGLTPSEGNHGEDVKEYYFYLDNTPTHSYMKYLYRRPTHMNGYWKKTGGAVAADPSSNCWIRAYSTRIGTSMSLSNTVRRPPKTSACALKL